jgi:hypothetical protein
MRFLLPLRMKVGMCILDDTNLWCVSSVLNISRKSRPYSFNGAESTKFAFQVSFIGIVAKARNNQRLERVTANVRVFVGLV